MVGTKGFAPLTSSMSKKRSTPELSARFRILYYLLSPTSAKLRSSVYLGAHVSISGGFDKCLDRIVNLGGNCLMTFASPPRTLKTKNFSAAEIADYLRKKAEYKLGPHFFHASYLINLASESSAYVKASIASVIYYQRLAGTILHIGSHKGQGLTATINQIVASVNYILDSSPKGIKLILENTAGQGGTVGVTFEELSEIIKRVGDRSKIGICLDTQHAFASGYQLGTALERFDRQIGLKFLSVIHLNDSATDFASRRDRHANLGEGKIGLENLRDFIDKCKSATKICPPLILEVPGDNHTGPRKTDLDILKSLAN